MTNKDKSPRRSEQPTRNPSQYSSTPKTEHSGQSKQDTSRSALSARLKASNTVELYAFEEDTSREGTPLVEVEALELDSDLAEPVKPHGKQQIGFKSEQGRLLLSLPPASEKSFSPIDWEELCQQLKLRLTSGERFFQPHTRVHLMAGDRLLDNRQLHEMNELLKTAQLCLTHVYTQRRQTAVAAVTAGYSVEQQTQVEHLNESSVEGKALEPPLYLQMTVRSGVEIRHAGSIIVLGDANPGSSLIAAGDIFVWGRLRGVAHAGSQGNTDCRIMALHMQPTQLRIAEQVARAPEKPPALYQPEVAYVAADGIRIAIASEFAQIHLNVP